MNAALDMSQFIVAKSDQLNADDLIGGPRTITVRSVSANPNSPEQPVSVFFEGDDNKPFRPCKTMRRVMVAAWGVDAASYAGKSMTLVRDPDVMFGGMKVGGIRITHMSHIEGTQSLAVMVSKGKKTLYKVQPLAMRAAKAAEEVHASAADDPRAKAFQWLSEFSASVSEAPDIDALATIQTDAAKALAKLRANHPDLADMADAAIQRRLSAFEAVDADGVVA